MILFFFDPYLFLFWSVSRLLGSKVATGIPIAVSEPPRSVGIKNMFEQKHTVDVRNPAPPWMIKTQIMGQIIYQLVQDFFHPQYLNKLIGLYHIAWFQEHWNQDPLLLRRFHKIPKTQHGPRWNLPKGKCDREWPSAIRVKGDTCFIYGCSSCSSPTNMALDPFPYQEVPKAFWFGYNTTSLELPIA